MSLVPPRTRSRSVFLILLDFMLISVTIACAVALLLGYTASWISPETISWVAFLGLGLHLLMLTNLLVLFFWMVRRSFIALIPAVTLLIGIAYIGDFVQLSFSKKYHDVPVNVGELTLMTYNVHHFHDFDHPGRSHKILDSLRIFLSIYKPDIICFQEYAYDHDKDSATMASTFGDWPYSRVVNNGGYGKTLAGLAIYSKYPIRRLDTIEFPQSGNMVISATIVRDRDTLQVFNCHLQSTQFNMVQPDGLSSIADDIDKKQTIRTIASTLKRNFVKRASQARLIDSLVQASPHTVILAGDFNDTPTSYAASRIRSTLDDSFRSAGSGYGYTYRPMRHLMRIDYILYNPDSLESVYYTSPDLPWSDHKPVVSRLRFIHD